MRATDRSIVFAVCGAAALAASVAPCDAQQVQVGTLACHGGPDTGFIVGPITNLNCVLHADSAPDSRYVAAIRNFGVFIGDQDVALTWKVMSQLPWLGLDDLAGGYAHAGGAGANVLIGGANSPIELRPLNGQDVDSPAPVKIESLELRPADR